jgi:hypothetical protein
MSINIVEITNPDGLVIEYVVIERGNDEFTSMTKEHYETTYGPIEGAE